MHVPEVPSDLVANWVLIPQEEGLHGKSEPSPERFWSAWNPCGEWFGRPEHLTTAGPPVGSPCLPWGSGVAGFVSSSLSHFFDVPPANKSSSFGFKGYRWSGSMQVLESPGPTLGDNSSLW